MDLGAPIGGGGSGGQIGQRNIASSDEFDQGGDGAGMGLSGGVGQPSLGLPVCAYNWASLSPSVLFCPSSPQNYVISAMLFLGPSRPTRPTRRIRNPTGWRSKAIMTPVSALAGSMARAVSPSSPLSQTSFLFPIIFRFAESSASSSAE